MDVVSHLIFGRVLAAIAPRPGPPSGDAPRRGLTAATVIGSIVPDADAVLMPFGWDRYLLWHQRGTHALIGTVADAIVFALVLRLLLDLWTPNPLSPIPGRGQGERYGGRHGEGQTARLSHLALAAWLGCLGHLLLDLISGGTIRLFAPFSTAPYGVPWMAMADPLIAVPLALFLIAAWRWRQPERVARFAWAAIVVIAAVVGVKEVSRRAAVGVYARASAGQPGIESPAIESAWASFTRWFAFDRTAPPARVRVFEIDAWRGTVRPLFSRDVAPPTDASSATLIQASTRLSTVRHLHVLFDLTFAEIRPNGNARLVDVLWSDIRFCWPTDCALWFGGTYDRSTGTLREQVVIVGTLRQTRAPSRRGT